MSEAKSATAHAVAALNEDAVAQFSADSAFANTLGHGIEKESLRVQPSGALSTLPHPSELGSALTHPHITTDFSEAQLELITGVHQSVDATLTELDAVHRFVSANIGDELLWPSSMPCILGDDEDIPLGRYGSSNTARAKTIYRSGLGHRYGRLMQTISGIHYNFSLPDSYWEHRTANGPKSATEQSVRTRGYFDLIRNFRRYSWLLIYLFGASPAICKSFVKGREHNLSTFDEGSLYLPQGTSLRMGRLGYQSDAQADLHVSYNSLADFAQTILAALTEPYPAYQDIGVFSREHGYKQLSDSIIQIENEFYGAIRPKQPTAKGERPLLALKRRGVAYVEVRCLDLNPFNPIGISATDARFIDTFLLFCLLSQSDPDSPDETARMQINQQRVVEQGRAPDTMIETANGAAPLAQVAKHILDSCQDIADIQDRAADNTASAAALAQQQAKVADPELTPSAQVIAAMTAQQVPFFRFAMNQALAHQRQFAEQPLAAGQRRQFEHLAEQSAHRQRLQEASEQQPFDEYLADYMALTDEARSAAEPEPAQASAGQ
ncbi:MAG: glutamate--cysteine ligase [Pseudomonadales bacterium]